MSKQEMMYLHVEDWQASGLTQLSYCKEQGLKVPTFSYWVQKYYKQSRQDNTSSFVCISKQALVANQEYELVYPNGVKLRLHTDNLSELHSLINLM